MYSTNSTSCSLSFSFKTGGISYFLLFTLVLLFPRSCGLYGYGVGYGISSTLPLLYQFISSILCSLWVFICLSLPPLEHARVSRYFWFSTRNASKLLLNVIVCLFIRFTSYILLKSSYIVIYFHKLYVFVLFFIVLSLFLC